MGAGSAVLSKYRGMHANGSKKLIVNQRARVRELENFFKIGSQNLALGLG
jgi:hypothetical protein